VNHIDGEKWKTVEEYPNYIISNMGRVFSKNRNGILKPYFSPFKNNTLYYYLKLVNEKGERISLKLHKIVAMAFVPNNNNKKIIHHIDGNRLNNRADNLMFVTETEHNELHRKMRESKK